MLNLAAWRELAAFSYGHERGVWAMLFVGLTIAPKNLIECSEETVFQPNTNDNP